MCFRTMPGGWASALAQPRPEVRARKPNEPKIIIKINDLTLRGQANIHPAAAPAEQRSRSEPGPHLAAGVVG